ncbi:MAG: PDDEXK nuclease domain-containing protein [Coriobacteriales bacterium]|nr:PDDEXK nuclease domain-containing protein [Coriobacteriales bacterium]
MTEGIEMALAKDEIDYVKTDSLIEDAEHIIDAAQSFARGAVNVALVRRNWLLGRRIAEEELGGSRRADYGSRVIKQLSKRLTESRGKGFAAPTLYRFVQFYKKFPEIFSTASRKSPQILTWSHYSILLRVENAKARMWYEQEALHEGWSVRTLDRNVSTLYYDRLLMSQDKEPVEKEMRERTAELEANRLEFVKSPVIAEFLGVPQDKSYTESELETAVIDNLQKFLLELGKGYAFVARQQHIRTDLDDFYIDLVFYNYILKCFVLIDLKTSKITHQDVGQMDMYVRMYDDLKRRNDDNPTLGIVLCTETSETIARYSVLHGNEQLFAAEYKLCLPSEEELRNEIENQKLMFRLQHGLTEEEYAHEG